MPCLLTVFCPSFPLCCVCISCLICAGYLEKKKTKAYLLNYFASNIYFYDQNTYFLSKLLKNYLNQKANQLNPGHICQSDYLQ